MRISFMRKLTQWYRLAAMLAVVGTAGCKSLEVTNPNAPDAERAFSDPGAVAGLVTGAMRNWVQTRETYDGALVLSAMADAYTASWNNFNLRYYTSYGVECPERCGWDNRPTSAFRIQVETFWYGYYGLLSAVNDVLTAIRVNDVVIGTQANTDMLEAVSVMLQGVVFTQIALNYDQGFIVDEATDLADPLSLPLEDRAAMRDAGIAKFDEAIALMQASPFAATPSTWLGSTNGPTYSSAQLIKLIRTMQAEALAYFPRTAAENATVNWGQVATYASQGISTAGGSDFEFYVDLNNMFSGLKHWSNDGGTMRVDTRLAAVITAGPDPSKVHVTPWPGPPGNPQPDAFDARVGDGTWGPVDDIVGSGTVAEDAGAGSDYAWSSKAIFNPTRGQFHQSNLIHVRYTYLSSPGYGLPGEDGTGFAPVYLQAMNDLLWAEGLIRSGGNQAQAAALINNTRVNRGHLSQLTGAEGSATLLAAVHYENMIELLGIGSTPFYNRRRNDELWPMTPRHMPIPAKELSVLKKELYSFGGPTNPAGLAPSLSVSGRSIPSARKIGDALLKQQLRMRSRRVQ
jgi:hypothetical protein